MIGYIIIYDIVEIIVGMSSYHYTFTLVTYRSKLTYTYDDHRIEYNCYNC